MSYRPKRRPKLAILYLRAGEGMSPSYNLEIQEENLRVQCKMERIKVAGVYRTECDSEESLAELWELTKRLPEGVDCIYAVRFCCYTMRIQELVNLSLKMHFYGVELYSMELPYPLWSCLWPITQKQVEYYRKLVAEEKEQKKQEAAKQNNSSSEVQAVPPKTEAT